MKKHRVAIIGLGRMGSTIDDEVRDYPAITLPYSIASAVSASSKLELCAGCDILPEKRDAFQKRWGCKALYHDYREMLSAEKPDLVAVCTKGPLHAEMGIAVAEAGVPTLYLEKAVAGSMREADALLDACQRHHTLMNSGVLRRFDNRYQQARRLIADGAIGVPQAVVHFNSGTLLHVHIHTIDTILMLLGDPQLESVCGELLPRTQSFAGPRLESDPKAVYQLEFVGGMMATTVPHGAYAFEVIGSKGMIRSENNGVDWRLYQSHPVGKRSFFREVPFPTVVPFSATQACLEDLVDAHEQRRPPLNPVELCHRETEICFLVAQSHRDGKRLSPPMTDRDFYIKHV